MVHPDLAEADDFDIQPRRSGPRKVKITREARTARLIFYLTPFVVLLLLFGPRFVLNSGRAKRALAVEVSEQVSRRAKASVRRMGSITFGWAYEPCLHASEIYRVRGEFEVVAKAKGACVDQWPSAVGSGFRSVRVSLEAPSLSLVGNRPSTPAAEAPKKKKKASKKQDPNAPQKLPSLREINVVFDDLRLDWHEMPLPAKIANGSFGPIDGSVTLQRRGRDSAVSLSIREPLTGMRMTGRATPTPEGWDLTAGVEGDLAPTFGPLLAASGLDIRKLPVNGNVGVFYSSKKNLVRLDIDLAQYNVDITNRHMSSKRIEGFEARQRVRVNIDLASQRVWIEDGLFDINGISGVLSMDLRIGAETPSFMVAAELRTLPVLRLLRAIPGGELPSSLSQMSASTQIAAKFSISGLLKDPTTWQPKLEHSLVGVGKDAVGSGLEPLLGQFEYFPLTKKGRSPTGRPAGPGSPTWVNYRRIPYVQRRAIQVSEDANFWIHNGIDIEEIRAAMVEGLTSGKKTRGGSTITQQLVKNLYLSRDRTAARKVQELFLTMLVESALTKEQIFGLYANIIEWGPNIYGLREASYYYFGKAPARLSAKQMTYLASVIPGPLLFHKYYEQGRVPPKHMAKVDFTLKRLRKLNTIKSDAVLESALAERIRFVKRTGLTPIEPTAEPDP